MPQLRKLAPEEVQTIENKGKGTRKLTEEQYNTFLSDYEVGEYGEALLDDGENRLTVRNRLKAAAGRRSVGIDFKRTTGNLIRFRIIDHTDGNGARAKPVRRIPEPEYVPEPEPEPAPVSSEAPPKRRGGRPKKNA